MSENIYSAQVPEFVAAATPQLTYETLLEQNDLHPGLRPHIERLAAERAHVNQAIEISPSHHVQHVEAARSVVANIEQKPAYVQDFIGEVLELGKEALDEPEAAVRSERAFTATLLEGEQELLQVKRRLHIPEGCSPKELQDIVAVNPVELAATRAQIASNRGIEGSAESWRQQVFGEVEVGVLKEDVIACLETPLEHRQGEPLLVGGRERRPVMNISLNAAAKQEIAATLLAREAGLRKVINQLHTMQERGEMLAGNLPTMLAEAKVLGRNHGCLFGAGESNPGATIADLYTDSSDTEQFAVIDALADDLTVPTELKPPACMDLMASEIIVLASNSFPSGVELMHCINRDAIEEVVDLGAIAPRSQRKHGATSGSNNTFNGGLVHMTGPASFASEYGTTVAGIPIDTIVKRSRYMQLEDAYMGSGFDFKDSAGASHRGSTQYEMGAIELHDLEHAPVAFQRAFQTMQHNISRGLLHGGIGQGRYNNLSFAAGGTAETAAAYTYPLEEVSLYVGNPDNAVALFDAAQRTGKAEAIATITSIAVSAERSLNQLRGESLNSATLPNFKLPDTNNSMLFFAPIASRDVAFTEGDVGNNNETRSIPYTLETVDAVRLPRYIDGLIADGMSVREAFAAAVDSINNSGAHVSDLILSYAGGKDTLLSNGVTAVDVFAGLSDSAFCAANAASFISNLSERTPNDVTEYSGESRRIEEQWVSRGRFATSQLKHDLLYGYALRAQRLFDTNPQAFVERSNIVIEMGLPLTESQAQAIAAFKAEKERLKETDFKVPSMPAF